MSAFDNPMPFYDARVYSPDVGEWLALRYATGEPDTSLAALHRADPERVPAPLIVRRWRSVYPAFDGLMVEADRARAEAMMDETVSIADDGSKLAANAKNGIAARWRMAESLDPARYGQRRILAGDASAPLRVGAAAELSDADLLAIARGADPVALLGGGAAKTPPAPPVEREQGLRRGDEGEHAFHNLLASRYPKEGGQDEGGVLDAVSQKIFEAPERFGMSVRRVEMGESSSTVAFSVRHDPGSFDEVLTEGEGDVDTGRG